MTALHIGFTGTRHGMTKAQVTSVERCIYWAAGPHELDIVAHHGDCVGADEQFHGLCRRNTRSVRIIVHPSTHHLRAFCAGDETLERLPPLDRNAAIVASSQVIIAAPYEDKTKLRGGTWSTIRIALRALRDGKLRELYVVGRSGELLDHGAWPR